MARPSPEQRKKIEANRKAKAKLRADNAAREKRTADRVQGIVETALARTRQPDLAELIAQLDEARMVALAAFPTLANAAVNATLAMGRLLGILVDRHAVAVGKPDEFRAVDREEEILERLRERVGSRNAERFMAFVQDMRREYTGDGDDDVIEGEARRLGNGSPDGGADE